MKPRNLSNVLIIFMSKQKQMRTAVKFCTNTHTHKSKMQIFLVKKRKPTSLSTIILAFIRQIENNQHQHHE